jgi:PIN domain nuclease of toxin-antitoxin system
VKVRLLLDSHVVVWWALTPGRLRPETRALIASPDTEVYLSAASVWELGLKIARRKLSLGDRFDEKLLADGMEELPVTIAHARGAQALPPLHADPFDRLLISQALVEGLMLVTSDREIARYDVPVLTA